MRRHGQCFEVFDQFSLDQPLKWKYDLLQLRGLLLTLAVSPYGAFEILHTSTLELIVFINTQGLIEMSPPLPVFMYSIKPNKDTTCAV